MKRAGQFFAFNAFRIYPAERLLMREDQPVPLKPKVFDLLMVLVRNSGHALKKDELMKEVWADSFVEEGNLAVSISALRKALGEDPAHSFIETVSRHGYRFVASVSEGLENSQTQTEVYATGTQTEVYATGTQTEVYATTLQKGSVAVLPFKHMGEVSDQYLGLGIADALITRLSNLKEVVVRPTSSVRKYNGSQDPILAGRDLKVEWVVDGSLKKQGTQLRASVQLVNVNDAASMWAKQFDEEVTNIFALEDSIAKQVAKAVTARLSGNERRLLEKRDTDNPQAYQAYLKGRYFYINRSKGSYKDSVQKAIQYFNQAIILDPKYALAYAGLADCYGVLHLHGIMSPQEAWPMAEKAAFTALQHDGELAEAHLSLGHLRTAQWDFAAAEKEYAKAIELKPNWGRLHSQYARYLAVLGRFDDALAENAKALEIDPLSVNVRSSRGGTLWLARRYDEAIQQLCTTLELDPRFGVAHFYLGLSYGSKKMYDEALLHLNKAETLLGKGPELLASLGRIHALAGRVREARETINELKGLSEENYVEPYFIALIYAALGETEAAFDWLEKAYSEHDEDLALIGVDPRVDSLRADPRFVSLLDRIGLSNTANRQTLKQPRAVGLVKKPVNERGSPL